jgi:hypothetical protein
MGSHIKNNCADEYQQKRTAVICLSNWLLGSLFCSKNEGRMFLRNVGKFLPAYIPSRPRESSKLLRLLRRLFFFMLLCRVQRVLGSISESTCIFISTWELGKTFTISKIYIESFNAILENKDSDIDDTKKRKKGKW